MNSKRGFNAEIIRSLFGDENGAILVVVLIFVGILALVGATATIITTTDTKIGANYKASEKALYEAEAGAQEGRQRLRQGVTGAITDAHTDKTQWRAYIGTDEKSLKKGWESTNAMHVKTGSLQSDIEYTVVITHQLDPSDPTKVLYWGDDNGDGTWTRNTTTGENIYLITSYGNVEGSTKTVQLEVTRVPPITFKGALYSGTSCDIQGNVTVNGNDSCGGAAKPGIATPQTEASTPVTISGTSASVTGNPNVAYADSASPITPINVQSLANGLKISADFSYSVNSDTSYSATTIPGPGDGWGTPDLTVDLSADPPTPNCDSYNIVHYDTNDDTNDTTISFSGNIAGCGILVVEGTLHITGGFEWYGTIIVTGAFRFTGGAGDKNIMGAVITGESTEGDYVGGNVDINYCSTATESQTQKHAIPILSWKEVLAE